MQTNQKNVTGLRPVANLDATVAALLAKAYPGIKSSRSDQPAYSTDDACALAKQYVAAAFPEHRCALLFGSYAKGQQKPGSDLDVLVVLPVGQVTEKRRLMHDGYPIELFIVTERTILEALAMSKRVGLRVFFDALEQGIVLNDRDGIASKLQMVGRNEFARPNHKPDLAAMQQFRLHITQNLAKLSNMGNPLDQLHLAALLHNSISFAVLRTETGWAYRSERLPRELQVYDDQAAKALNTGLLEVGAGQGVKSFIEAGVQLLDRLGGPVWDGTSEPMFKLSDTPASL